VTGGSQSLSSLPPRTLIVTRRCYVPQICIIMCFCTMPTHPHTCTCSFHARPPPSWTPAFTTSQPTSFPQFQLFPKEIRDQIWRLSVQPRLIDAHLELWNYSLRRPVAEHQGTARRFRAVPWRAPLPSTFHACRESRAAVQSLYKPFFGSDNFYIAEGTVINFDVDILYCANKRFKPGPSRIGDADRFVPSQLAWDEKLVSKVTSFAIYRSELEIMDPSFNKWEYALVALRKFPRLREIILIDPEILEGHGSRDFDPDGWCGPAVTRYNGPVELMEAEKWQPSDCKETAIMTNEFLQVNLFKAWLKKAKLSATDGWEAPEIKYYRAVRWRNGSKISQ
jgi:hypothetical protein